MIDGQSISERSEPVTEEYLRPQRVAYVVSLFPCWSETFIAEEVLKLLELGFDITIFSLRPARETEVHSSSNGLLPRVKYASSYGQLLAAQLHFLANRPGAYLSQFFKILTGEKLSVQSMKSLATFFIATGFARTIEEKKFERVHAHWATFGATGAWTISQLTGIPFSFTTHAHDLFIPDSLLPKKIKAAQFVVTISEYNRRLLQDKYQAAGKTRIVHCGVDGERFAPVKDYKWATKSILAVGRLNPIKGFPTLIRACAILREQGIEFRCEIVGDGPLAASMRRQIDKLGIADCVHMSGFATQEQVRDKLAEASMFVMPSEESKTDGRDGIPVALMEAMSMGIPVISTYVSGIPELVENGFSGVLVEPDQPAALAKAIGELLEDRELCIRLAANAERTVRQEFDIRNNARNLALLFTRGR